MFYEQSQGPASQKFLRLSAEVQEKAFTTPSHHNLRSLRVLKSEPEVKSKHQQLAHALEAGRVQKANMLQLVEHKALQLFEKKLAEAKTQEQQQKVSLEEAR